MANDVKGYKDEALSSLAVIHSINSDPSLADNDALKDSFIKDLPSQPGQVGKKLSDLKGKLKKKKENVQSRDVAFLKRGDGGDRDDDRKFFARI